MTNKQSKLDRRTFLSSAAIVGATGALGAGGLLTACGGGGYTPLRKPGEYYIPELPDKAIDGKPLRAALIGCGSRGGGAAMNFLRAGDGLSIVAMADVFGDRMNTLRERLKERANNEVPDDKCFIGFDAYRKVLELPEVDVAIIATPSIFHPVQLKYAVDMGKHVFCEKAACIDAVGYRLYMQAIRQALNNGLNVITGTQRHHQRGYVESYKRVQEGYIGRIVSGNVYWNQGHMNHTPRRPEWTDMEYMLRDFFSWNWLCGDHVIDQLVHNIDVFVWFSHLKPERVICFGSRIRRNSSMGNIYDNFSADFEFEGGIHMHGMARQVDSCDNRIGEIIQGTKGSWSSLNNQFTIFDLDGNIVWQFDREAEEEQYEVRDPYTLEHVNLVNCIRQGKVIDIAEITAVSSMAGIMARESAYTGKAFTWDEMTSSDLNLLPDELHLGDVDMSIHAVPIAGSIARERPPRPEGAPSQRPQQPAQS